jgi:tetratricopeptide (TPR) repeat protein
MPYPMRRRVLLWLFLAGLIPQRALAMSPKDLLDAGRVDEAIQTFQQRIAQSPNDAESYNFLCRAYFMLEEWDSGISACEHAVELDPQNSLYYLWLGRAYGEKADRSGFFSAAGLAKKVRNSFEHAVALDPQNWEARTDLAEFYLEAPGIVGGGKDKALRQADVLMSVNPAMAHWILGRVAEKSKDSRAAESEFRAEIAASHSGARAWIDLAIFLRHQHRLDEMERAVESLDSSRIDRPESIMDGASILLRAGRNLSLAVRLVERYLTSPVEEGPAFKAHDLLGQLLEKQGDRQGAAQQYRAALSLAHIYARAQENLKRLER